MREIQNDTGGIKNEGSVTGSIQESQQTESVGKVQRNQDYMKTFHLFQLSSTALQLNFILVCKIYNNAQNKFYRGLY